MHRNRRVAFITVFLLVPLMSWAADCAVLFGQGQPPPSSDTLVNDHWNRLNFSFHDAFQYQLSEGGLRVVPVFLTVQSVDAAANAERVRKAAAEAGCSRLVGLRVFGDEEGATPQLVFAVSAARLRRDGASSPSVDAAEYKKEYRFAATPEALSQVVPSRLAAQAVRDLPDEWKR
jgi:hypothetical protein